jgi:hypothetical protein
MFAVEQSSSMHPKRKPSVPPMDLIKGVIYGPPTENYDGKRCLAPVAGP